MRRFGEVVLAVSRKRVTHRSQPATARSLESGILVPVRDDKVNRQKIRLTTSAIPLQRGVKKRELRYSLFEKKR